MKKLFLVGALALFGEVNAQTKDVLSKGHWLVETNTNFGVLSPSNTYIGFMSSDGTSLFKIGGEAGYFVANNLALKVGLGLTTMTGEDFYGDSETVSAFNYKVGVKYYIASQFPVQVDFSGISSEGSSTSAIGFQGGYAWFVAPNISIEPGLRYDVSADDGGDGIFSGNVGFAIHF